MSLISFSFVHTFFNFDFGRFSTLLTTLAHNKPSNIAKKSKTKIRNPNETFSKCIWSEKMTTSRKKTTTKEKCIFSRDQAFWHWHWLRLQKSIYLSLFYPASHKPLISSIFMPAFFVQNFGANKFQTQNTAL